ncbi:MAG: ion transporter, partial [Acidobacteriota bacterium]
MSADPTPTDPDAPHPRAVRPLGSRVVDALIAERTVIAVILINAVALMSQGASTDLTAANPLARLALGIDIACVLFFALEAALKIQRFGWDGYKARAWNRFDFIILLVSLPVLLTPWIDLHQLGAVTLLRLGRLFRLFRLLRFIPDRDHLIAGIGRALRASVGVFLALMLVNLIFGIGATLLFGELAPEHFGNPLLACYALFKVLTIEGWYELPDLIAARADHPAMAAVARLYFMAAVLIGGILGLSLANAVFVDE